MVKSMKCLEAGLFSRATLKPLNEIFDFEYEKRIFREYLASGEWFMVSGIRRVGKTTIVRSIANVIDARCIYVNLWEVDIDRPFQDFIFRFMRELLSLKDSSWRQKLRSIEEVSVLGFRVRIREINRDFFLDELINSLLDKRLIVILDEIHALENELKNFSRLLASLHDRFAPRLSVVLLGSIASIRNLLERKLEETEPLFGRVIREFNLKPFDKAKAKKFLIEGFNECGVPVSEEDIDRAVDYLGTITGWLVEFGREYTLEWRATKNVNIFDILQRVYNKGKNIVYGEIARMLKGKKRIDIYLKILKLIASNPNISLKELSEALKRRKPTILQYLDYLIQRNVIEAIKGHYNIIDPLYRRTILDPKFEIEVKKRL